jgi:hypothetical protein
MQTKLKTARAPFVLIACVVTLTAARAEDEIKLAIGARGNWETAAA